MKITVSVADPVMAKADALARRMKITRSELFARALKECLANASEIEAESLTTKR